MDRRTYMALVGQELGLSDWFVIGQDRIDAFADVTEDHQFIHVDPVAAKDSPFGTTIAHGFLVLSMLSAMIKHAVPRIDGEVMGVNYGFDRVRFVSPVPSGARLRARFTLKAVDEVAGGGIQSALGVVIEIEGQEKPALVADWLVRRYLAQEA